MSTMFASLGLNALGLGGGGNSGASGPTSSGPANNHSIVVNGASGGAVADLAQLLGAVQGPSSNGGFSGITASRYGGLQIGTPGSSLPILLIGGLALAALLLLRK